MSSTKLFAIVFLTIVLTLSPAQIAMSWEQCAGTSCWLGYDNGTGVGGFGGGAPYLVAVRFSLPTGWCNPKLLTVSYYVMGMSGDHTFKVRVFDNDHVTDLLNPPLVQAYSSFGWLPVDLSGYNIVLPHTDFYVAWEWGTGSPGYDNATSQGRSYWGQTPGTLAPFTLGNIMIRAQVEQEGSGLAELSNFTESPTGDVLMVLSDIAINPHGSKPSGVGYQQGRDATPLGYLRGMVNNTQPSIFDTNTAVNATSGRPAGDWPIIFSIGGPSINAVTYYYENTNVATDKAPVKLGYNSTHFWWALTSNGTKVYINLQSNTAVPPGTSDVFVIQTLRDADNRTVVLMYGSRYTGTWAAAEHFKFIIYPNIEDYTDNYYIVGWTDAASGTSANMTPDSADTFTILAQG